MDIEYRPSVDLGCNLIPDVANAQADSAVPLLPGIVVLNHSYLPETPNSPAKVGATAFAMSAIRVLKEAELFRGIILYRRQEDLQQPIITTEVRNSIMCVTIMFNFEMETALLKTAMCTAAGVLTCGDTNPLPMLYYQTDTLLKHHPDHLPLCVTHHAPFYEDFARRFSDESAGTAFGDQQKAHHLQIQQNLGILQLKARDSAFVFQHSQLQGRYLTKVGIDSTKVFQLCPPIHSMRVTDFPEIIHNTLQEALSSPGMLLFTAVARLDYFKDVDLLVDAALQLHQQSFPVTVLIAGDDEEDTHRRAKLSAKIPASHRRFFYIMPRLQKNMLYALFERCRHKGLFVCSSRYETLGITPLESGFRGVTTLIPDSKQVEASRFFSGKYRYLPTATKLATAVEFFRQASLYDYGMELREHLEKNISEEKFKSDFLHAWWECSQWVRQPSQP